MPRGPQSEADRRLIDALAEDGLVVSAYQLERWRHLGLLPRTTRRGLGRGRGSTSSYPEGTVELAVAVAAGMRRGRPARQVALSLFAESKAVPEPAVRAALEHEIDRLARRRPPAETDQEVTQAFGAAYRRARRLSSQEPILPLAAGLNPFQQTPASQASHRQRARALRKSVELADVAASIGYQDLAGEQIEDVLEGLGLAYDPKAIEDTVEQENGRLDAQYSASFFRTALEEASWEQVCRARDIAIGVMTINPILAMVSLISVDAGGLPPRFSTDPLASVLMLWPALPEEQRHQAAMPILLLLTDDRLLQVAEEYFARAGQWFAQNVSRLIAEAETVATSGRPTGR